MRYTELQSLAVKAIDALIATGIKKKLVFKMLEIPEGVYEVLKNPGFDEVIAQKLWTVADVVDMIGEQYDFADCPDDTLKAAVKAVKSDAGLENNEDSEWQAIKDAIKRTTALKVSDIEWDVDEEDFDNEAEYFAVVENLPDTVRIPSENLAGNNGDAEVEDFLSDTYGYCVKSYIAEIVKKEAA